MEYKMEFQKESKSVKYDLGDRLFYRESGEISLVEVLENNSDNEGIKLKLKILQNCNCDGITGTEFSFFIAPRGGSFGMASVGKTYPSYRGCRILNRLLERMGLNYFDLLDYQSSKQGSK